MTDTPEPPRIADEFRTLVDAFKIVDGFENADVRAAALIQLGILTRPFLIDRAPAPEIEISQNQKSLAEYLKRHERHGGVELPKVEIEGLVKFMDEGGFS